MPFKNNAVSTGNYLIKIKSKYEQNSFVAKPYLENLVPKSITIGL